MHYTIRTVTPLVEISPVIELAEAKEHLRVDHDEDDALIEAYLAAAQDHIERHTSQVLTPRVMEMAVRGFPIGGRSGAAFDIPRTPVTGIEAIDYLDSDGIAAALAEEDWRWTESAASLVRPAIAASWPAAYDEDGSVRLTFEAGYDLGLAPGSLSSAVKLLLGTFYAQREGVITGTIATQLPGGVEALCAPYRRVSI